MSMLLSGNQRPIAAHIADVTADDVEYYRIIGDSPYRCMAWVMLLVYPDISG